MASDKVVIDIVAKDDTKKGIKKAEKSFKGLAATVTKLAGAGFGIVAIKSFGEAMLDANIQIQKLNASLISVTGSQEKANDALAWLREFAKETPFQLNEVVDSFIKMKALGLDPTEESLRSFGNTASAMGKDLNQMIEAVADAATGEFERLKEFGIKSKSEGDKVSFTFQNVTTTVGKNAKEITSFLESIGKEKFGNAMSEQMKTLGGSISNLEDSWQNLLVLIGEVGAAEAAADSVGILSSALERLGRRVQLFDAYKKGGIGFFDFLLTSTDDADELLENVGFIDEALIDLTDTVTDLRKHKSGNFWWTAREEKSLQTAIQRLADYKTQLLATGGIDAPAGRGGSPVDVEFQKKKAAVVLEIQKQAGIEQSLQQQAIDDRQQEQLRILMAANKEQYALDVTAKKEAADQKAANDQLARDTAMTALADLGSLMNTESRRAFEVGKVASIASTIIKTYEGATSAFASGAKIHVAVGIAAAAAAVAAGLANVQKIQSTQFGGGGGGSPSVPNISPSNIGPQAQTVAQPTATVGELTGGAAVEVRTGSFLGVYIEEQLIPAMNEANRRGVKLIVT